MPESVVSAIYSDDIDHRLVRAMAQWRLDYPFPHRTVGQRAAREIVAVAESLLTRGTAPLCSPAIEAALELAFGSGPFQPSTRPTPGLTEALRRLAYAPTVTYVPTALESVEENAIATALSAVIERESLAWHMVAHVRLASLDPQFEPAADEHGDLLLVHPEQSPLLVEVDGEAQPSDIEAVIARDAQLAAAGIRVIRVPAAEARAGGGHALARVVVHLRAGRVDVPTETRLSAVLRASKLIHQIQLALLEALRGEWIELGGTWRVGIVLPRMMAAHTQIAELAEWAVMEFCELLDHIALLYGRSRHNSRLRLFIAKAEEVAAGRSLARHDLDLVIGPAGGISDDFVADSCPRFLFSDTCFPRDIAVPVSAAPAVSVTEPRKASAQWFLHYLFRKKEFREGQWEAVERCLQGLDSVILLPTGAGKSIAFQLAALMLPGRCVVVDPIVSLIDDQVDNLKRVGIDRCVGITSQLRTDERTRVTRTFASGHFLFCYVAPERFQTEPFRDALRTLTVHTPISLIAIDEAHCVSEWGHDFRTAYLNLGRISREYCASQGVVPPLIALTGTASKIVLRDVQRELDIGAFNAIITPKTFDRPELRFTVLRCRSEEKAQRLQGFFEGLPTEFAVERTTMFRANGDRTHAGLVFCPHVNGKYGTMDHAAELSRVLGTRVEVYSGSAPRGVDDQDWERRKQQTARDFKRNRVALMACTKAFGMGIDKPNIRYTAHIALPESIEAFYQEAGRAGRDRAPANCAVIISNDNPRRTERLLSPNTPLNEVLRATRETKWGEADDIVRALYFHANSFRGQDDEMTDLQTLIGHLGDVSTEGKRRIPWLSGPAGGLDDRGRERAEKALHRLVVLGVLRDYTIDYAAREFTINLSGATQQEVVANYAAYAGSYQKKLGEQARIEALRCLGDDHRAFIIAVTRLLVNFVYEHIEQARRRSLNEMLVAATRAGSGEDLRRRIVEYLQQTEYDDRLNELIASEQGGVDALDPLLDDLVSPGDAAALRGAVSRLLGSYPDLPGLLLLRALSEALARDSDAATVRQNLGAFFGFGRGKYLLSPEQLAVAAAHAIRAAQAKRGVAAWMLALCLTAQGTDRAFVRAMLERLPETMATPAAAWLAGKLVDRAAAVRRKDGDEP